MSSTLSAWGIRVKAQSEKIIMSTTSTKSGIVGAAAGGSGGGGGGDVSSSSSTAVSVLDKEDADFNNDDGHDQNDHPFRHKTPKGASTATSLALAGLWGFSSPHSTARTSKDNAAAVMTPRECDMYVQSNLGACFCVSDEGSRTSTTTGVAAANAIRSSITNKSMHVVSTSSLLLIRTSPTTPCPNKGWMFQWYYSSSRETRSRMVVPMSPSFLYDSIVHVDDGQTTSKKNVHSNSNSTDGNSINDDPLTDNNYTDGGEEDGVDDEETWTILPGATHAAFQPNTTLVGRRLRCIVKIPIRIDDSNESKRKNVKGVGDDDDEENSCSSSASQDKDADDVEKKDVGGTLDENCTDDERKTKLEGIGGNKDIKVIVCDLRDPVVADMTMFNGARQAMSKPFGAKFGSLVGRLNSPAAGETFRVEISSAQTTLVLKNRPLSVNAVRLYRKLDDGTFAPVFDDIAILNVSARADPAHGRHVDLIFSTLPPSLSSDLVEEQLLKFCTVGFGVDGINRNAPRLELETSNRMARESFLLALGIANFQGDPSSLNNITVLYQDEPRPKSTKNVLDGSTCKEEKIEGAWLSQYSVSEHHQGAVAENCINAVGVLDYSTPPTPDNILASETSGMCKSTSEKAAAGPVKGANTSTSAILDSPSQIDPEIVKELNQMGGELQMLRSKLMQNDKDMANLLHDFQKAEDDHQKTKQLHESCERELRQSLQDCERIQQSKRQVERTMQSSQEAMKKVEANHRAQVQNFEAEKIKQDEKIADLEKTIRVLQNEKAVLGAAVEARESKLSQLDELKSSNDSLAQQIAQQEELNKKIEASNQRSVELQNELHAKSQIEMECRKDLKDALALLEQLQVSRKKEQEKAASCVAQFESLQKKNRELKGERNNLSRKNESLSKEISRICRDGRTIRDVEKMIADHDSLKNEVVILRTQKRKALEEAQLYRKLYEQVKAAEQLHGVEEDTRRALQRTTELERLLLEMTDYVHAKEMQLETMKQVNEALQEEIKNLAKASFQKNDV